MDSVIFFIDDGTIATNFYAMKANQACKRALLGVNRYFDKMSIDHVKTIVDRSDKVYTYNITNHFGDTGFIFDKLIEDGVDFSKICSIGKEIYNFGTARKDVTKYHSNDFLEHVLMDSDYDSHWDISGRFESIALESWHNLYWQSRDTWNIIHDNHTKELKCITDALCKEYNISNDTLIKNIRNSKSESYEHVNININDAREFRRLYYGCNYGFMIQLYVSQKREFIYSFGNTDKSYWRLDNKKYYTVKINGFAMGLRYVLGIDLNELLSDLEIEGTITNSDEKHKLKKKAFHYENEYIERHNINSKYNHPFNSTIVKFIDSIYKSDKGINLIECDQFDIAFACTYEVDLRNMLISIKNSIDELGLNNCFDNIEVCKGVREPYCKDWADFKNGIPISSINNIINNCKLSNKEFIEQLKNNDEV